MGEYSPEPPRKDLHFHYPFDFYDEDSGEVIDIGPRGNHGTIVGGVEVAVPGIDGSAFRIEGDQDAHVVINDNIGDTEEITTSMWTYFEEPVDSSKQIDWELNLDGNKELLTWQYPSELSGWHYFVGWYDGESMRMYHGTEEDEPEQVAARDASGTVSNSFLLQPDMSFIVRLDDARTYTRGLERQEITDVWRIAAEHNLSKEVGRHWPTRGLPYEEDEGNERFAASLAENDEWVQRQLDAILEARHIDTASGPQLDRIGDLIGVRRQVNENNTQYRARIKATAIAGRSAGTFEHILDAIVAILNIEPEDVVIERTGDATATITIQSSDLGGENIDLNDLDSIVQDLVMAGHEISAVEVGSSPFTLKEDGDTDDPSLGLTSDSVQTGGTLVTDI